MRNTATGNASASLADRLKGIKIPDKEEVKRGAHKARGFLSKIVWALGVGIALLDGQPSALGAQPDAGQPQGIQPDADKLDREFDFDDADADVVDPRPPILRTETGS